VSAGIRRKNVKPAWAIPQNERVSGLLIHNNLMGIHITTTKLDGVVVITPDVIRDDRGFFLESYNRKLFHAQGLGFEFVQDNHSRSSQGVVRGIHFQGMAAPQVKLVRCTAGRILDVAVDLRAGSPTFGQWVAEELSAENMRQMLVPVGFGHGFATLSEVAEVQYKCTDYYAPAAEGSVVWNDPQLAIAWPYETPILSGKDSRAQTLEAYLKAPAFVYGR
jgi:dTDP-4-dehydrorhamnose 3,5-epimerase